MVFCRTNLIFLQIDNITYQEREQLETTRQKSCTNKIRVLMCMTLSAYHLLHLLDKDATNIGLQSN
jgi:hypothetical protein